MEIKALYKEKQVIIIGFELGGYCMCMDSCGAIFYANPEDLTINDKEYLEKCIDRNCIKKDLAVIKEFVLKRLDNVQLQSVLAVILELDEYRNKIEKGTLKEEKPCVYQEYNDGDWSYWECSNCGEPFCFNNECTPYENQYHYCPNCGARITEYKEIE